MTTRVAAIVQARMGSTRLPGKVLEAIEGRTMLDRVVTRLTRAGGIDEVAVATGNLGQDDAIVEHCRTLGVRVERGDPLDVLSRYTAVTRELRADVVVRITADCPFLDPDVVAEVVASLVDAEETVDYASNTLDPRTFPRGLDVEVVTADALFEADRLDLDPCTREHVTPFIRTCRRFRLSSTRYSEDLSAIRWTVDTREDLEAARRMAAHFGGQDDTAWKDLLEAWCRNPEWQLLNNHVEQIQVKQRES